MARFQTSSSFLFFSTHANFVIPSEARNLLFLPASPFLNFNLQTDDATSMVILSESSSERISLFNVLQLHSNDISIIT